MIAKTFSRLGRITAPLLLTFAFAACKPAHDDRPAAPQAGAPAPEVTVPVAQDRGRKQGEEVAATPEADQSAFSHADNGEAERAASKRGHDSAGAQAPAAQPQGGQ